MRPWFLAMVLLGCGASQSEVDNLERRVNTLERRIRALEGGEAPSPKGKIKAKARRGGRATLAPAAFTPAPPSPPAPVGEGTVEIDGTATRVVLANAGGERPVPGRVPSGTWAILAEFPGRDGLQKAGKVHVGPDATVRIRCESGTGACSQE